MWKNWLEIYILKLAYDVRCIDFKTILVNVFAFSGKSSNSPVKITTKGVKPTGFSNVDVIITFHPFFSGQKFQKNFYARHEISFPTLIYLYLWRHIWGVSMTGNFFFSVPLLGSRDHLEPNISLLFQISRSMVIHTGL